MIKVAYAVTFLLREHQGCTRDSEFSFDSVLNLQKYQCTEIGKQDIVQLDNCEIFVPSTEFTWFSMVTPTQ